VVWLRGPCLRNIPLVVCYIVFVAMLPHHMFLGHRIWPGKGNKYCSSQFPRSILQLTMLPLSFPPSCLSFLCFKDRGQDQGRPADGRHGVMGGMGPRAHGQLRLCAPRTAPPVHQLHPDLLQCLPQLPRQPKGRFLFRARTRVFVNTFSFFLFWTWTKTAPSHHHKTKQPTACERRWPTPGARSRGKAPRTTLKDPRPRLQMSPLQPNRVNADLSLNGSWPQHVLAPRSNCAAGATFASLPTFISSPLLEFEC